MAGRWMGCLWAGFAVLGLVGCATLEASPPATAKNCRGDGTGFRPSSRTGQFDARLDGDTLRIELKVAFDWLDGDPDRIPGYEAAAFTWTEDEKAVFQQELARRVAETWSGAYPIESTDGTRRLRVQVAVKPAPLEQAHWLIEVFHYPSDGPDTPASVCDPAHFHLAAGCEPNAEGRTWGTVRLTNTHLRGEHVRDLEIPPFDVWFEHGGAEAPDLNGDPPAWLASIPAWQFRITGFADGFEVDTRGDRDAARPTVELARRRTQKVREALLDLACPTRAGAPADPKCRTEAGKRLHVRNLGAYGESPHARRNFVRLDLFRTPPIDTLTHEAGHMLGLGDEASGVGGRVGEPVLSAEYAALVLWYTGYVLTRVDDEGIMSRGNVVRPWHYAPFLEALEVLTCSAEWRIVEPEADAVPEATPPIDLPPSRKMPRPERPEASPQGFGPPPVPIVCGLRARAGEE
jgi:hypothetical protein